MSRAKASNPKVKPGFFDVDKEMQWYKTDNSTSERQKRWARKNYLDGKKLKLEETN